MNEVVVLTPERILEVTENVLRRYGLAKATVVDVARALDVSHGSVYRHFPSKASLREAVAKRWLERLNAPLQAIAEASGPAPVRLERWLRTMFSIKHKKVSDDPEMFQTYLTLAREACKMVRAHKEGLVDQIAAQHILAMHFLKAHCLVGLDVRFQLARLYRNGHMIEEEKSRYLFQFCTHYSNSTTTCPACTLSP